MILSLKYRILSSIMDRFYLICFWSILINVQLIRSSSSLSSSSPAYLYTKTSQYQPVVNLPLNDNILNQTEIYRQTSNNNKIQPVTSGWTPVITSTNNVMINSNKNSNYPQQQSSSNSAYTAINPGTPSPLSPSSSSVVTKVVPLVAHVGSNRSSSALNVTTHYLTSESVARGSYQKPQNTYMIHPTKYQQAFSSMATATKSNRSAKSLGNSKLQRKSNINDNNNYNHNSKLNKIIPSEVMPIPMIKPHRHGATLGFNLPDQGLTLYLDINELATKPMAQNIGLKVVAHNKPNDPLHHVTATTSSSSGTGVSGVEEEDEDYEENSFNSKIIELKPTNQTTGTYASATTTMPTSQKLPASLSRIGLENSQSAQQLQQRKMDNTHSSPKKIVVKKAKFRYKMTDNKTYKVITRNKMPSSQIISPIQANNAKLIQQKQQQQHQKEINDNSSSFSFGKLKPGNRTDIPPSASRIPSTYTSQTHMNDEYEVDVDTNNNRVQQQKTDAKDGGTKKTEREIISFEDDEDDPDNISGNDEDDDEEDVMNDSSITTEFPLETTTTFWTRRRNSHYVGDDLVTNGNTVEESVRKQEAIDNQLVQQMQTLLEKSAKLIEMSANTCAKGKNACNVCQSMCSTNMASITSNTSTTIREIAHQLDANFILNEVSSLFESELQDFMDFTNKGYTIILPSNTAVRRLPPNLLKRWKQNFESFSMHSYLIEGTHTIESLLASKTIMTRKRMKLFIKNPFNHTYTINGQRVIYANQKSSNNGLVHVIDGLLFPGSDKDIIETLRSCGRFDGFVTLAEGTGFADTLRKEGPFTVFVPSNDALQKVPDQDLEVIRRNMTALKEFLMYHVAQGIHFSQDLSDGQFLPSILEGQFLQSGVRVDGCSRRLVEVNVSPLYRADIPASNGVIHVVDWILKPDDRDWCNGIILPRR